MHAVWVRYELVEGIVQRQRKTEGVTGKERAAAVHVYVAQPTAPSIGVCAVREK